MEDVIRSLQILSDSVRPDKCTGGFSIVNEVETHGTTYESHVNHVEMQISTEHQSFSEVPHQQPGVEMDLSEVKAVTLLPILSSMKDLVSWFQGQRFLGFAYFY